MHNFAWNLQFNFDKPETHFSGARSCVISEVFKYPWKLILTFDRKLFLSASKSSWEIFFRIWFGTGAFSVVDSNISSVNETVDLAKPTRKLRITKICIFASLVEANLIQNDFLISECQKKNRLRMGNSKNLRSTSFSPISYTDINNFYFYKISFKSLRCLLSFSNFLEAFLNLHLNFHANIEWVLHRFWSKKWEKCYWVTGFVEKCHGVCRKERLTKYIEF